VLTIYLNNDYAPFKRYLSARQRDLTSSKVSHAKNRYAVDVGVAMLVLENDRQRRLTRGETLDEGLLEVARDAAAQGALSILPYFDEITKQAGIET
jgi:xanthine/CO dehydrogenase XdhC/CoxF family maturation factor